MADSSAPTKAIKRFTIEEANAMLPLVRSIVSDISEVFRNVTGRRADLHRLLRKGIRSTGEQYADEVAESRSDLQEEYDQIWRYREELESLGVILRQPEEGHIEFPTVVDQRDAFYLWKIGDKEVQSWRFADSRAATRLQLEG